MPLLIDNAQQNGGGLSGQTKLPLITWIRLDLRIHRDYFVLKLSSKLLSRNSSPVAFGTNLPFTKDPPNGLSELDTPPFRGTEPDVSGGLLALSMN
jgi:hypothetical protein